MKKPVIKLDVSVGGRAGRLSIEANRVRYSREEGESLEREFSLEALSDSLYSVIIEGRSYSVLVTSRRGSEAQLNVNGQAIQVEAFDPRELRTRNHAGSKAGRVNVAALMPGKVVRLLVQTGDSVEAGQGLIVVEAMKMQNEMKSPKAGRVIDVRTTAGVTVAAGEVLLVIE